MRKIVLAVCGAMLGMVAPITASAMTKTAEVVVETKTETVTWQPISKQSSAQKKVTVFTPDKAIVKKKAAKKKSKKRSKAKK